MTDRIGVTECICVNILTAAVSFCIHIHILISIHTVLWYTVLNVIYIFHYMCISVHWLDKPEFDLLTRGGKVQKLVVSDFHEMVVPSHSFRPFSFWSFVRRWRSIVNQLAASNVSSENFMTIEYQLRLECCLKIVSQIDLRNSFNYNWGHKATLLRRGEYDHVDCVNYKMNNLDVRTLNFVLTVQAACKRNNTSKQQSTEIMPERYQYLIQRIFRI